MKNKEKWSLGITEGKGYIKGIADFDRIEDAEFAIKAVNSHDELVEALRTCSNALDALGGKQGSYEVEKARKIIAKAEGK